MRTTILLAILCAVSSVLANFHQGSHGKVARNHRLGRSAVTAAGSKRCAASKSSSTNASTTSKKATATSSKASASTTAVKAVSTTSSQTDVISGTSSICGNSGATSQTTADSGRNGNIDWLNCGINSASGWQPPHVTIDQIVTVNLTEALESSSSPFKSCNAYIDLFTKYGEQYNIPSIMLAAFALQESSCNPNTVGGGGEQGLMQISEDKCVGAPDGNCKDPDFNIKTGAKYFAGVLSDNGGNVLESVGTYNGWFVGMTYADATAAAKSSCCLCQQNLDYLMQYFNGWVQNIDAYSMKLGTYFNLDVC